MEFSAKQIAGLLNGTIEGDENVKISSLSKIEDGKSGSLSFLSNFYVNKITIEKSEYFFDLKKNILSQNIILHVCT